MAMRTAKICMERWLNITTVADFGKHFYHQLLPYFKLSWTCHVKVVKPIKAFCLPLQNFIVSGQIKLSRVHLIFHTHSSVSSKYRVINHIPSFHVLIILTQIPLKCKLAYGDSNYNIAIPASM